MAEHFIKIASELSTFSSDDANTPTTSKQPYGNEKHSDAISLQDIIVDIGDKHEIDSRVSDRRDLDQTESTFGIQIDTLNVCRFSTAVKSNLFILIHMTFSGKT